MLPALFAIGEVGAMGLTLLSSRTEKSTLTFGLEKSSTIDSCAFAPSGVAMTPALTLSEITKE